MVRLLSKFFHRKYLEKNDQMLLIFFHGNGHDWRYFHIVERKIMSCLFFHNSFARSSPSASIA